MYLSRSREDLVQTHLDVTKIRILRQKNHYQPFVFRSVSFTKCKQFLNTAIQKKHQLETKHTDKKPTPTKEATFLIKKKSKGKCV